MLQSKTAAKNAAKVSTYKTILESNRNWKESELSLNGVFKYLASKQGKQDVKAFLSALNEDLKTSGKSPLLIEDFTLSNFLTNVKPLTITFKGEIKPYLPESKKLFSVSFVLKGFMLSAKA